MIRADRSNGILAAEKWICDNPEKWAKSHAGVQARRRQIRMKQMAELLRRRHRVSGKSER